MYKYLQRAVLSYDSLNSLFCEVCAVVLVCIQLFRERLSYKRGKAYAIMSKVIMGNGGFYCCLSKPQGVSAWWKETAQTRTRFFSSLVAESPWTSIKQSQTLTTHNTNRHCRVRFYTFVGQPLWKQLYTCIYMINPPISGNLTLLIMNQKRTIF